MISPLLPIPLPWVWALELSRPSNMLAITDCRCLRRVLLLLLLRCRCRLRMAATTTSPTNRNKVKAVACSVILPEPPLLEADFARRISRNHRFALEWRCASGQFHAAWGTSFRDLPSCCVSWPPVLVAWQIEGLVLTLSCSCCVWFRCLINCYWLTFFLLSLALWVETDCVVCLLLLACSLLACLLFVECGVVWCGVVCVIVTLTFPNVQKQGGCQQLCILRYVHLRRFHTIWVSAIFRDAERGRPNRMEFDDSNRYIESHLWPKMVNRRSQQLPPHQVCGYSQFLHGNDWGKWYSSMKLLIIHSKQSNTQLFLLCTI